MVIDFAENYSQEPKFEHQSRYFSQVQTTIVPVVVMLRVEDVTNIPERGKNDLLELFGRLSLPHVKSKTHYLLSSDMQHDSAFVLKGLDDHIIPYLKRVNPSVTCLHTRSDGCKVCAVPPGIARLAVLILGGG